MGDHESLTYVQINFVQAHALSKNNLCLVLCISLEYVRHPKKIKTRPKPNQKIYKTNKK